MSLFKPQTTAGMIEDDLRAFSLPVPAPAILMRPPVHNNPRLCLGRTGDRISDLSIYLVILVPYGYDGLA